EVGVEEEVEVLVGVLWGGVGVVLVVVVVDLPAQKGDALPDGRPDGGKLLGGHGGRSPARRTGLGGPRRGLCPARGRFASLAGNPTPCSPPPGRSRPAPRPAATSSRRTAGRRATPTAAGGCRPRWPSAPAPAPRRRPERSRRRRGRPGAGAGTAGCATRTAKTCGSALVRHRPPTGYPPAPSRPAPRAGTTGRSPSRRSPGCRCRGRGCSAPTGRSRRGSSPAPP